MKPLLLSYYGDDFTGSTDVMEALSMAGVPTVLFLEPPAREVLEQEFPDVKAVGVAGVSRSLTPEAMEATLRPRFEALRALGAERFHYKVCSTFDSSAHVGSIGKAMEIGREVFGTQTIPLVVGAPKLRRYVAFGNLFATVAGTTYRLDRHPTMSRHPVTPMSESDLRKHLAEQTALSGALVDVLALEGGYDLASKLYAEAIGTGAGYVLFDTVNESHLATIGRLLWEADGAATRYIVGSSGVEYALTLHWHKLGMTRYPALETLTPVSPFLVMSGSASPATAGQLAYVEKLGWEMIRIDCVKLLDAARVAEERGRVVEQAVRLLRERKCVAVFANRGPEDPAIAETVAFSKRAGIAQAGVALAAEQGGLLRAIAEQVDLPRICLAGGDTSGYGAQALGIYALEFVTPIAPGSPMCRTRSNEAFFDKKEIALKGGQVGGPDYFDCIRQGRILT